MAEQEEKKLVVPDCTVKPGAEIVLEYYDKTMKMRVFPG